jgi:hypothetical protein
LTDGVLGAAQMGGTGVFPKVEHSGTRRSGAARAATALVGLAALAACSSSSSSPATSSSPASASGPTASSTTPAVTAPSPSASPAVVGTPACPNGSLQIKLGLAQGYAGGTYQVIDFTNSSGSTCTLTGYPGVSLVSGPPFTQIGLAAKRGGTTPVKTITLAPGATANALLQIVDALNFPTATCSPAKATDLRVYPPNQTLAVFLTSASEGCAEPVQVLFISAVQAGSGGG